MYLSPAGGAATITVFLHGMCANGGLECPVFAGASRASWLLCPDGGISCGGGGWMWSLPPRQAEARIEAAVAALKAAQPGKIGEGPRAIVGYSLGAPSALVQAMMGKGRYDRLMIVNASVEPAPPAMKEAGVKRVALVAGERDATAQKLQAAAARLKRAGVDARYFALQKTGHYFDGTSRERMDEPLEWLLAPLEAPARL